jgi:bacteriorhodopsin
MFQHFSGRTAFLVHASIGLACFAYALSGPVGNYVDLSAQRRLEEVSAEDRNQILEEQMKQASRISLIFSSAFFFMLSCWLMTHLTETNFSLVQRSTMGKRLDFCLTLCLYITFFSALFNAIQLMDDDNLMVTTIDGEQTVLDLGRIAEWMLTCPLIQLAVPVLGGEKVPDYRRVVMPITSFGVLLLGFMSTLAEDLVGRALMYAAASVVFLVLLYFMNACVHEASDGGENLFSGTSPLRGLVVLIGLTWAPFPLWFALSPEGFNIVKDAPGMKVAVAFLNLLSKGSFILYLVRVRTDHQTRQKTMVSIGYITANGQAKDKALEGQEESGRDADEKMDKTTMHLIEEVLETMGRAKDKAFVVDLLQSHLITTNADILSLTKEYCREINLPWGLVLALKSKIRSHSVQAEEGWSMQVTPKAKSSELSYAAPHIVKNNKKIESVRRRQTLLADGFDGSDKASNAPSNFGYPSSSMSDALSPASLTTRGSAAPADGNGDDARVAALLDSHQKSVNAQVDECRQFVMHSMDKIMNVLEHRLADADGNPHPQPQQLHHVPPGAA